MEGAMRSASPVAETSSPASSRPVPLHPAWLAFIRHCRDLRHGEIERLVIQDGLPVLAELTRKKVRFV